MLSAVAYTAVLDQTIERPNRWKRTHVVTRSESCNVMKHQARRFRPSSADVAARVRVAGEAETSRTAAVESAETRDIVLRLLPRKVSKTSGRPRVGRNRYRPNPLPTSTDATPGKRTLPARSKGRKKAARSGT